MFLVVGSIDCQSIDQAIRKRHAKGALPFPAQRAFGWRTFAGSHRCSSLIGVGLRQQARPSGGITGRRERRQHTGHVSRVGAGVVHGQAIRMARVPLCRCRTLHPTLGAAQVSDAFGQVGGQGELPRLQDQAGPCSDDRRSVRQVREGIEYQRLLGRRRHVVPGVRVDGAVGQVIDRCSRGKRIDQVRGLFLRPVDARSLAPVGGDQRAQNPPRLRRPGDVRLVDVAAPGGGVVAASRKAEREREHREARLRERHGCRAGFVEQLALRYRIYECGQLCLQLIQWREGKRFRARNAYRCHVEIAGGTQA